MSTRSEELTSVLKQVQGNPSLLRLVKKAPNDARAILNVSQSTIDAILSANRLVGIGPGGDVTTFTFDTGSTITGNPGPGPTTFTFDTGTTITAGGLGGIGRPTFGMDPVLGVVLEHALDNQVFGRKLLNSLRQRR